MGTWLTAILRRTNAHNLSDNTPRIVLSNVTQYVLKAHIRQKPWVLAGLSRCIRLELICMGIIA